MKRFIAIATAICALAFAAAAAARSYRGCSIQATPVASPRPTPAASCTWRRMSDSDERGGGRGHHRPRGADVQLGSFTLASASQCQGGSPRFDVVTTAGLFFLGCNNVAPTTPTDDYTFTRRRSRRPAQVPFPTGTITATRS